jgi:hypothetical protein
MSNVFRATRGDLAELVLVFVIVLAVYAGFALFIISTSN